MRPRVKSAEDARAYPSAFPESLTSSGQAVVEALNDKLSRNIPVFGATSGDGYVLKRTYQFFGREVFVDSIPVLLLSGPLVYSAAAASGWEPMGEPGTVTRADNTLLYEIDGRPATEFYRRFLGSHAVPTPEFPLAILNSQGAVESLSERRLVNMRPRRARSPFSPRFAEGVTVQIATADRTAILDGSKDTIEKAFANYPHGKTPEAALMFSCSFPASARNTHGRGMRCRRVGSWPRHSGDRVLRLRRDRAGRLCRRRVQVPRREPRLSHPGNMTRDA